MSVGRPGIVSSDALSLTLGVFDSTDPETRTAVDARVGRENAFKARVTRASRFQLFGCCLGLGVTKTSLVCQLIKSGFEVGDDKPHLVRYPYGRDHVHFWTKYIGPAFRSAMIIGLIGRILIDHQVDQ